MATIKTLPLLLLLLRFSAASDISCADNYISTVESCDPHSHDSLEAQAECCDDVEALAMQDCSCFSSLKTIWPELDEEHEITKKIADTLNLCIHLGHIRLEDINFFSCQSPRDISHEVGVDSMEVQDEKNENMADWSPKSLYDDDSDGVDLEVADAAGQKPEAASAKNVAEMDEGNDLLGFDQWMHDTNHSTSQSKVSGSSSKYELELAAHNNDDYYEDAETIEEVHGDLYDDYHYDYADGTLDPKGEIEELDRVIEIIQRLDKMKSSKETAPEKATEAGWQTDVFEMEIDADIEVDQSMEADHGIEIDVDIEEVVECDTEDSRCDELIQAHEEYEYDGWSKTSEAATLGEIVTSVLLDGMGMSMAVNGAVQDIHSWVVKLTQDVIRLSQLGRLAGAMGFTLDSIEMDIDFTQEALGKGEYRQDNQFDVDVEIEIEITDDVDDTDIGGEDGEFEIEITIDAESDDQASTLLAQKLAEQLPIQLSGIMEKMDLSGDAKSITQKLKPQLEKAIPKLVQDLEEQYDYEYRDDYDTSILFDAGKTVSVDESTGFSDTESKGDDHDDGHPTYWEVDINDIAAMKTHKTEQVPFVIRSKEPLVPPSFGEGSPVTLRVNPADPSEIVVILEVGEDEEVVITLENESGDHITVEVEDDMLATPHKVEVGSGNSVFLRSPTKSHKHFSVDILPFVFADDSQVEAFVSKQEATHSVQPCNLEITISNEIRVAGLGGSKRAAEFVVEASAADLALEGEADSLDIVIDWNQAGSKHVDNQDLVTVELDLQVDSAEGLDITVDILEASREGETAAHRGTDPFEVIDQLQQYIFRLECVFVVVYSTVCIALLAIFFYLYQMYTSRDDDTAEQHDEESAALSLAPASATSFIEDTKQHINIILAADFIGSKSTGEADGYYVPLPEGDSSSKQ